MSSATGPEPAGAYMKERQLPGKPQPPRGAEAHADRPGEATRDPQRGEAGEVHRQNPERTEGQKKPERGESMTVDEYGLTVKQRIFADEYIRTGNATEAARKAGYTNPTQSSKDNTRKQTVKAYIAARMAPTEARRIADADEVLDFLSKTMRGEIKDQFGLDASLQDRIKAAQELMKRYAVADMRQQSTLQRLDDIFISFRAALDAPGTAPGATALPPQLPAPQAEAGATGGEA